MALTVQAIPTTGAPLAVTFTAVSSAETFANSNRELVMVRATGAAATTGVVVEGVASADSGRDGSQTLAPLVADEFVVAGPFKSRNFNVGGVVEVSSTTPANLEIAVVRFDPNG